jgi:micrococcal nuclease
MAWSVWGVLVGWLLVAPAWGLEGPVTRVLDGDTIEVAVAPDNAEGIESPVRVRLIGVNTPERSSKIPCERRWAEQARQFTITWTADQRVTLLLDVERRDKYNRLLAYVSIGAGDEATLLNAELLAQGLAWVGEMGRNTLDRLLFRALETQAKAQRLGVWGD